MEVRRKNDGVMAILLTLGKEMMRIICMYEPQNGRPDTEKFRFLEVLMKSLFFGGISMDMWGNVLSILKEYTGVWYWEKK